MRDPLPSPLLFAIVLISALFPFLFPQPGAIAAGIEAVVLFLGALSVVPVVGWLKTVTVASPAAAGIAGWATAEMLLRGQSLPVAAVVAAAAGSAVALVALAPVRSHLRSGLPWSSLVLLLVVWGFLLTRVSAPGLVRAVFIGIDLSSPRALYLVGVIAATISAAATIRLAGSRQGRLIATAGAAPQYAAQIGGDVDHLAIVATAHSGAIAGLAGLIVALQQQGAPSATSFSPTVALVWLGAALLGGAGWTSGAIAGAVAVTLVIALTPLPPLAVGALALVLAVVLDRGLTAMLPTVRRRPKAVTT